MSSNVVVGNTAKHYKSQKTVPILILCQYSLYGEEWATDSYINTKDCVMALAYIRIEYLSLFWYICKRSIKMMKHEIVMFSLCFLHYYSLSCIRNEFDPRTESFYFHCSFCQINSLNVEIALRWTLNTLKPKHIHNARDSIPSCNSYINLIRTTNTNRYKSRMIVYSLHFTCTCNVEQKNI